MGRMRNEDVERLLRELPRDQPPADFTDRVLARLDARAARARGRRSSLLAAAAAVAAVVVWTSGYLAERYERSSAAERVESLRREYRDLRDELDQVRALAEQLEPVLRLGGTEDVEFVFDLRELAADGEHPREDSPAATPASHVPNP